VQQLKFQHKGRRGEIVPIKCACDQPTPAEDVDLEALRAAKAQKTVQKKRVGNMDALDRTGQGIKESYARKVCPQAHQTACVYPSPPVPYTPCLLSLSASRRADASVKEIFSKILFGKPGTTPYEQLLTSDSEDEGSDGEGSGGAGADPVGLTGKQGGKVLACFLLSERDNPDFAKAFERGILPWLEKEQPKYNPWPPTKILWKETIKWLPIIEAGLARAQRRPPPMPDFGEPGPSSQPPMPDFR